MKNNSIYLIAVSAALFSGIVHGEALDFNYRATGQAEMRPTLIFNDGKNTYVQPSPLSAAIKIKVKNASAEQYGPYLLISGVPSEFELLVGKQSIKIIHTRSESQGDPVQSLTGEARALEVQAQQNVSQRRDESSRPGGGTGCRVSTRKSVNTYAVTYRNGASDLSGKITRDLENAILPASEIDSITIELEAPSEYRANQRKQRLKDTITSWGIASDKIQINIRPQSAVGTEVIVNKTHIKGCDNGAPILKAISKNRITALGEGRPSQILENVLGQLGIDFRLTGVEPSETRVKVSLRDQHLLILLQQIGEQLGKRADVINRDAEIELHYRGEIK